MSRRRSLTEADILERSAALFAARGYAATSVQDIADALGMSRPSLYHYFPGKEEILARLLDGLLDSAERAMAEADTDGRPPDEALGRLVRALITPIAESPGRFRLLRTSEAAVTAGNRDRSAKLERSIVKSVAQVIADGVSAGVFRRCDQHIATLAILGMINWIAWWNKPIPGASVIELCDTMADLAVASLRADPDDGRGDQPTAVIASIRRDLQHLDDLLQDT